MRPPTPEPWWRRSAPAQGLGLPVLTRVGQVLDWQWAGPEEAPVGRQVWREGLRRRDARRMCGKLQMRPCADGEDLSGRKEPLRQAGQSSWSRATCKHVTNLANSPGGADTESCVDGLVLTSLAAPQPRAGWPKGIQGRVSPGLGELGPWGVVWKPGWGGGFCMFLWPRLGSPAREQVSWPHGRGCSRRTWAGGPCPSTLLPTRPGLCHRTAASTCPVENPRNKDRIHTFPSL